MKLISFWSKQLVVFTLRGYKAMIISALGKRKKGRKKRQEERKEEKKERRKKRETVFGPNAHVSSSSI